MNIVLAGKLFGKEYFNNVIIKENTISYAIQKFNENLLEALHTMEERTILVISPVKTRERAIKSEKIEDTCYKYLYYSGKLGHISLILQSFYAILKRRPEFIIADVLNISQTIGCIWAAKFCGSKVIGTVTDIPEDVLLGKKSIMSKIFYYIMDGCDGFVFLTEQTNQDFNKQKKPYVIIEGIAQKPEYEKGRNSESCCIYAGGLSKKYSVIELTEAFANIAKENEYLDVYGDGECKDEIIGAAKRSVHIRYRGTVGNDEIVRAEINAVLLINPRTNNGDYTKYSFPSKVIEYMASGTPMLGNRLDGMPDEYYHHMFLFEGYSVSDFEKSIRGILDMEETIRDKVGQEAQEFIFARNGVIEAGEKLKGLLHEIKAN